MVRMGSALPFEPTRSKISLREPINAARANFAISWLKSALIRVKERG
jgi:hypothetical protein